jgi:hypothetical protein
MRGIAVFAWDCTLILTYLVPCDSEADMLDAYFGIPSMVSFNRGENGLIRVFLKHPYSESAAEIYLHGATVTQVCVAGETDEPLGNLSRLPERL